MYMYMYIQLSIVVEVEIQVGVLFVKIACSHTVLWTKYQVQKIIRNIEINIECNCSALYLCMYQCYVMHYMYYTCISAMLKNVINQIFTAYSTIMDSTINQLSNLSVIHIILFIKIHNLQLHSNYRIACIQACIYYCQQLMIIIKIIIILNQCMIANE